MQNTIFCCNKKASNIFMFKNQEKNQENLENTNIFGESEGDYTTSFIYSHAETTEFFYNGDKQNLLNPYDSELMKLDLANMLDYLRLVMLKASLLNKIKKLIANILF